MNIEIPTLSLVVLIGASGSGKSTFAKKHFKPTEVLSSDACRALVSDDETDQAATKDAFDVLHTIAGKRLAAGRLTVVDATNVQIEARRPPHRTSWSPPPSPASPCGTTEGPITAPSTSSATCTAAARSSSRCFAAWDMISSRSVTPRDAKWYSSVTSSTVVRTSPVSSASRCAWWRSGARWRCPATTR